MVNFPTILLDHFRCSQCYCTLSVGPVRCGPDGAPVCGRCPNSVRDVPNPPLQALLARYAFPCRHAAKGCNEIIPFNDVHHEQECQFQVAESKTAFETIDPTMMDNMKCSNCKQNLSVGPLSLTAEGDSVCGRCFDHWTEVYGEGMLVRNWKLEFVMQKLPLQCSYYKEGCRRVLKWGEVQHHEDFCPFRSCNCPATPLDSCQVALPATNLLQHFEQEHPTLVHKTPKFEQDLTQDSYTHRLLKLKEDIYLVMSKNSVVENRLWTSVAYVGDVDAAKHLKYTLTFSNCEETVNLASKQESVLTNMLFRINEDVSVPMTLDGLRVFLREPNLQQIVCSIAVCDEEASPNVPMFKCCKWDECQLIGEHLDMDRHEHVCTERLVDCKWTHCERQLPNSQTESHEATCDERIVKCRFEDCSIECLGKDWDRHVTQCEHHYEHVFALCNSNCKEQLPPAAMACHVLSSHPENIVEGATVTRTHKRGTDSDDFVYLQYDGRLFRGECEFDSDGRVHFSLVFAELDVDYNCSIKVIHPSDPHQTITRDLNNLDGIFISEDVLAPFMQSDQITYELRIDENRE